MLTTLVSVWLLYVAAMVSPGANVLLVLQLAASDQTRNAWFAGLGVAVGAGIWAACAVLGVNAFFSVFPGLRLSLQIVGGAYLLYLATRLWRSGATSWRGAAASISGLAAFRLGLFTNVTNPKAALFFGSVFAAAFPAQPSAALQAAAVVVVVASAVCWYAVLAYLFSRQKIQSAYSRASRVVSRAASVAFAAFGMGLLLAALREARAGLAPR
jgi:threonine/homoserine/homoserine lactone efflux protein